MRRRDRCAVVFDEHPRRKSRPFTSEINRTRSFFKPNATIPLLRKPMTFFIRLLMLVSVLLGSFSHAKAASSPFGGPLDLDRGALELVVIANEAANTRLPAPVEPSETYPPHNLHCKAAAIQPSAPDIGGTLEVASSGYPAMTNHGSGRTPGRIDRPPIPSP